MPNLIDSRPLVPKEDKKKHGIRYSFAKRLAIVEAVESGMPLDEIERVHHVSPSTIHTIRHDPALAEVTNPKIVDARRKNMAKILESIADLAISSITPEKLESLNGFQLMTVAAIAIDKARLLMNLSTENISVKAVSEIVATELEAIRKRRVTLNLRAHSLENKPADAYLKKLDNQQQRVLVNSDISSIDAPNTNTPESQSLSDDGIKHNTGYQRVKTKRKLDKSAGVWEGEI